MKPQLSLNLSNAIYITLLMTIFIKLNKTQLQTTIAYRNSAPYINLTYIVTQYLTLKSLSSPVYFHIDTCVFPHLTLL